MDPAWWVFLGGAAALLLVLVVLMLTLLLLGRAERRRARRDDGSREQLAALQARVDELTEQLERSRSAGSSVLPASELVITTAGRPHGESGPPRHVSDRVVLSATLGEPLVRLAALGYGVRRALSPESRNRIAFEMRREVKRARKERRRAARRARHTDPGKEAA